VSTALQLQPRSASARCVLCHDDLEQVAVTCPDCGTLVHEECQLDRCPTLGCASENPWEWVHLPAEPWAARSPWRQPLILLNVILLGLIVFGVTAEWALEACALESGRPWVQTFSRPDMHPSLLDSRPPCEFGEEWEPVEGHRACGCSHWAPPERRLRYRIEAHELRRGSPGCGCQDEHWALRQGIANEVFGAADEGSETYLLTRSGHAWVREVVRIPGCGIRFQGPEAIEEVHTPAGSFECTYEHTSTGEGDSRVDLETWTAPGVPLPVVTQVTWRTPGAPGGFPNVRRSVLQRIDPPPNGK